MQRLCTSLVLGLGLGLGHMVLPAQAATKPDDPVTVINYSESVTTPRYVKKWKDISLDAKNRAGLMQVNAKLDASHAPGGEKFKLAFILLYNGNLNRASFHGDYGSVFMMSWPPGSDPQEYGCWLSFDGNGGFTGMNKTPCQAQPL